MEAKYFIEAFKNKERANLLTGGIQNIAFLDKALSTTRMSRDLQTIVIFKIKPKSQEVIDNYERQLREKAYGVH